MILTYLRSSERLFYFERLGLLGTTNAAQLIMIWQVIKLVIIIQKQLNHLNLVFINISFLIKSPEYQFIHLWSKF
jgi:hypothetical protein